MLIGQDDISDDFSRVFNVHIHTRFRFRADWWKSDSSVDWEQLLGELEAQFKFQRRSCKLSFLFPPHRQSLQELQSGYIEKCQAVFSGYMYP